MGLSEGERTLGFAHATRPENGQRTAAVQQRFDLAAIHCPRPIKVCKGAGRRTEGGGAKRARGSADVAAAFSIGPT